MTAPPSPEPNLPSGVALPKRQSFRLIPRLEADPRIVSFCQTAIGKLLLMAVFGLTMSATRGMDTSGIFTLAMLTAMAFLPRARWLLAFAATALLTNYFWFEGGVLTRIAAAESAQFTHLKLALCIVVPFVLLCAALMWLAARRPKSWFARRPVACLLGMYAALLAGACYAPLHGFARFALWAFLIVFSTYFWNLAYALTDCSTPGGGNLVRGFATFRPFWGPTTVPYPKGVGYLRRIEAQTPEELAVTMIKGVKLMAWCFLVSWVNRYYPILIHDKLGVPHFDDCLNAFSTGKPLPWALNWLSLPSDFLEGLLLLSVSGHIIIATCRMAGFRALRNTYSPLSSRTVAEYWNRYYYYFKELLADMFFYPAFVRYFKRSPKLRIFFATFAAASVGNVLFHFMRDIHNVVNWGLMKSIIGFQTYVFYSLILTLGISVSQIRKRKPLGSRGWFHERVAAPACVLGFYCLVHVFDASSLTLLGPRLHYFIFLFSGRTSLS